MAKSRLHQLAERGQSVWFDTLSRDLVQTGELKRMMEEDAVVGVTSNPTIFQKAVSQGNAYDEQLKELLEDEDDAKATYDEAILLHEWIDRPNLYVKIPGTEPGLQAIEDCIAIGRSINVTLLFSLQ